MKLFNDLKRAAIAGINEFDRLRNKELMMRRITFNVSYVNNSNGFFVTHEINLQDFIDWIIALEMGIGSRYANFDNINIARTKYKNEKQNRKKSA